MAGLLIRLFTLLAMPLVATGVWAQSTVADPTRPILLRERREFIAMGVNRVDQHFRGLLCEF